MLRGTVEIHAIESACLRGNVLGDPSTRDVVVYLPPGYAESGSRRYPLIVLLAAYGSTARTFVNYRLWEKSALEHYEDGLAAPAEADARPREAIVVAPDCMTRWGGSQYLDSSATGAYQTHVLDEVIPWVDARYRTIPRADARAVVGHSSGGFGALRMALDRPGSFAAIGSHAGDALFAASIRPSFTEVAITLDREGGLVPFIERFARTGPRGGGDFNTIMTIALAAAYAPVQGAPFPHCALPFDPRTAIEVPEVWARFLAHDPVVMLERDPRALADAALVHLDSGDRDEHGLQLGARRMHELLRARGARVVYEEFPGGHRGTAHRFAISLPRLAAALADG